MARNAGKGVVVAAVLLVVAVWVLCTRAKSEKRDAEGFAMSALSSIAREWDSKELWTRTSAEFHNSHSAPAVERDFDMMNQDLGHLRMAAHTSWSEEMTSTGRRATVELNAHFEKKEKAVRCAGSRGWSLENGRFSCSQIV